MSDNIASIDATLSKTTDNYAVYEGDGLTGTYVNLDQFEGEAPEEVTFVVGEDGAVTVEKTADTKNYGNYESEGDAIVAMYLAHDLIGSEETEDGFSAPESLDLTIQVAADSEDSDESDEEEVEVSDEELSIPSDD